MSEDPKPYTAFPGEEPWALAARHRALAAAREGVSAAALLVRIDRLRDRETCRLTGAVRCYTLLSLRRLARV